MFSSRPLRLAIAVVYTTVTLSVATLHTHDHGSECCHNVSHAVHSGEHQSLACGEIGNPVHCCDCEHLGSAEIRQIAAKTATIGLFANGLLIAGDSSPSKTCLACFFAGHSSSVVSEKAIFSVLRFYDEPTTGSQTANSSSVILPPVRGPPSRFL